MSKMLSVPVTTPLTRPQGIFRRRSSSDNEFLAPALEILETPASPVRIAFIWIICCLAATSMTWAYFGRIDIVAVAQGKFQPTGRVKVIEPLATGKVAAIPVVNGSHVAAGDTLVELDRAEAEADRATAREGLESLRAEAARRGAALAAARADRFDAVPPIAWSVDVPLPLRLREERVLEADLGQIAANIASLDAQRVQKQAERDVLAQTIAAQQKLIATLQQRVDMRQALLESNSGAKSAVIDATEVLQLQITQLSVQKGQLASLDAGIDVSARDLVKAKTTFVFDNAQKLAENERQIEDFQQRVAKASARIDSLTLKSPIDGIVQSSVISTIGQVVAGGQEVMRVVPDKSGLEIEVYVMNKDVGFIKLGQDVVIKVEPFPFTQYGTIDARVIRIASDAIPEPDASLIEGDPSRPSAASSFAGTQRTQNLVFPVTLMPVSTSMRVDGETVALTSGMAAVAEFKTGRRRMIEYFFSPLVEIGSGAMRER